MNLLLVDDEVTTIQILTKAVDWKSIGIKHVYTAYNAAVAKKVFAENEIDVLICDIEMPQENGLDLIQWVQGLYPNVINIILTGYADFNYARNAISLGVYSFLLKPVAFDELKQTVKEAIVKIESEQLQGSVLWSEMDTGNKKSAVKQVKEYLEKHYNEVITRNHIESLVHLNRDYINREFKEATGYSLMEYIQHYRILIAKKLLRETEDTVSEICIKTGYDSPAYFSKIFKKRTGMTPVDYRNQNTPYPNYLSDSQLGTR